MDYLCRLAPYDGKPHHVHRMMLGTNLTILIVWQTIHPLPWSLLTLVPIDSRNDDESDLTAGCTTSAKVTQETLRGEELPIRECSGRSHICAGAYRRHGLYHT